MNDTEQEMMAELTKFLLRKICEVADRENYDRDPERTIVRKCKAKVTRNSGTEQISATGEITNQDVRFLVRFSNTVLDEDMIVEYGGKEYNIYYLNDYNDGHEYTEIWAKKKELV